MPLLKLLLVFGLVLGAAPTAHAAELTVAAASSVQEPLLELARRFEADSGHRIRPVFGASGKLFAQISQGAPFDVYVAADADYPARLHAKGLVEAPRRYARGRLVVWVPARSDLVPERGMSLLLDRRVRRIAIANPRHAPYGRAAVEAMRAHGVYGGASGKLAMGENVAQALQFVESGAADAALVPLFLARSKKLAGRGRSWLVPASAHAPLDAQAAVVRASAERPVAERFLDYMTGDRAADVWRRYGLESER